MTKLGRCGLSYRDFHITIRFYYWEGFCEGGVLQDTIQECHPFGSGFIGERSPSGDIKLLGCVIVQPQLEVLKQHMVGNGQVWAGMCELRESSPCCPKGLHLILTKVEDFFTQGSDARNKEECETKPVPQFLPFSVYLPYVMGVPLFRFLGKGERK